MRTPVPKCLERKRKRWGIGSFGKRRAMIGKEQAATVSDMETQRSMPAWSIPKVDKKRMRTSAKT